MEKKRVYDTVDKEEVADGHFPSLLPPAAHM
jgi:hypothetical protein